LGQYGSILDAMSVPIPRDPVLDLASVPRHWLADNAAATAISNALNLLFPAGERFFVRSVHAFVDQLDDEARAKVKGFFGQEGRHARAHDEFNDVLRAQGFEIDDFLARYERIARWIEDHLPSKLNLAGTAACEHFTAILADGAFNDGILDALHPTMQQLLAWHAAEEIEHKAVAFDVLRSVDSSYALRMAGLFYATTMLGAFCAWGTVVLWRQEGLTVRAALRQLRGLRKRDPVVRRVFGRGIREYIRRGFHPDDRANYHLAAAWFTAHGLTFPDAA
jgi:predicted metal-dependent hydrolase